MDTDVTEAGPFERLLTLHLEEAELEEAKNAAARKLSRELKIKGFRPGKAPRAIVERMVGPDALRSEALDHALPDLVGSAIAESDLAPVTTPQIQDVKDREEGGVEVEVKITLWPTLTTVPTLERTIEVDYPEVEPSELEEQIDRVRGQYAELEDVQRAGDEGDFVMINLSAQRNGETLEDVSATDLLYEIGSRSYIPGLDDLLVGVSAGEIKKGPAQLPAGFGEHGGEEVTLQVLVKGVKAKKLPELSDEWVSDVSEFETVAELTAQLEKGLLAMKLNASQGAYRDQVIDALIDDMDLELPEALVAAEIESSFHNLAHSLQSQGLDIATYLQITGQDQQAFLDDLRGGAERSLKSRVLLEAVAAEAGIEVDGDEIEAAIVDMAESSGRDVDEIRSMLTTSGQDSILTSDILRRKALDWVMEAATPVDANGNPVELTLAVDDDEDDSDDDDTDGMPVDASAGGQDPAETAEEDA